MKAQSTKPIVRIDNPQDEKAIQLANKVVERILKHVGVKCPHCIKLLQKIEQHWCDRCGEETKELVYIEQYKGGDESQLCRRCALQQ